MNPHPLICPCGSLKFGRRMVMFPMRWTAECQRCGRLALVCEMKPAPTRKPPPETRTYDSGWQGPWA